jgi:hypothetical protein
MKMSLLVATASGFLMLALAGNAVAVPVYYSESYSPGENYLMDKNGLGQYQTHQWTFDITDNTGWSEGQLFNDGTITLVVEDDAGPGDGDDKASFTFDTGTGLTNTNINSSAWDAAFTVDYSAFYDGLISATLVATSGDFYFRSALLEVSSDYTEEVSTTAPAPIPEPSTVLLLGAGLGCLAIWRKKKST